LYAIWLSFAVSGSHPGRFVNGVILPLAVIRSLALFAAAFDRVENPPRSVPCRSISRAVATAAGVTDG